MSARRILTVGLELAATETTYASFRSKMSLLDWDIVLFKPEISEFVENYYTTHQGKPSLGDTASFEAKECCEHWRREIKQAVETGKTVLVHCVIENAPHLWSDAAHGEDESDADRERATAVGGA